MATALAYAARRTRLSHLGAIVATLSKTDLYAADRLCSSWRAEVSKAALSSLAWSNLATKMSFDLFFGTGCRVLYTRCQQAHVADSVKTSELCESDGRFGGSGAVGLRHPPRCLPPTGPYTAVSLPNTYSHDTLPCMLRQACGIMAGPCDRASTTCRQPSCLTLPTPPAQYPTFMLATPRQKHIAISAYRVNQLPPLASAFSWRCCG